MFRSRLLRLRTVRFERCRIRIFRFERIKTTPDQSLHRVDGVAVRHELHLFTCVRHCEQKSVPRDSFERDARESVDGEALTEMHPARCVLLFDRRESTLCELLHVTHTFI